MADTPALPQLSNRREQFVSEYLGAARMNATEAARRVGYKRPGTEGYRLLKNDDILAHITARLQAQQASSDAVLAELTDVAFAEWRDFITVLEYDESGKPLKTKMDLTSKVKSLELLAKAHQLLSENVKVSGRVDHVHRSPALDALSDDELDRLEAIAQTAYRGDG